MCVVLGGVFFGLFLSPVHGQESAWFCLLGAIMACLLMSTHDIRHVLEAVEWDTLLFFASLFVFVETLAELGLIRAIANALASIIKEVDPESRLAVAMILFLWVSGIGSAFLESLPYTTAVTYVLINLDNNNDLGIPIDALAWALSVGACIGGIGSIMGSSANLVAISVSQRYSPDRPLEGKHFLQYGFPLLLVLLVIATLYQYILFSIIEPYKCSVDAMGEKVC
jgi:Na+/H+ antiporter NhaD/arsenite permease-like protein